MGFNTLVLCYFVIFCTESFCLDISEKVQLVSDSPVEVIESNNLSIQFNHDSECFILHSKTMNPTMSIEEVESIQFFYRSNINSKKQKNYSSLLFNHSTYPQPGIHILIEYKSPQHKTLSATEKINQYITNTLDFSFFSSNKESHQNISPISNFLMQEGAKIKSPEWLFGNYNIQSKNDVEYFYKSLTTEEHQHLSKQTSKIRNQQNNPFFFLFSNLFQVESQPTQSLQSILIQSNSTNSFFQENSMVSLPSNKLLLQEKDITFDIIHNCNEKEECSFIEIKNNKSTQKGHFLLSSSNHAISLTNFKRSVEGAGFHKELKTTLEIQVHNDEIMKSPENQRLCDVFLIERISEDFFVDRYQVEEKLRFGALSEVILDHTIDLEKPSYQSSPNVIIVKQNVKVLVCKFSFFLFYLIFFFFLGTKI